MSNRFELDIEDIERLQRALERFPGHGEEAINEVLHGEGAVEIQDAIRLLIPVSGKRWKGKKEAASTGNSLMAVPANLSVTVKTTKPYQYLYFPDDGKNTQRHAGNQQFFARGAEDVSSNVVGRCVANIIKKFKEGE